MIDTLDDIEPPYREGNSDKVNRIVKLPTSDSIVELCNKLCKEHKGFAALTIILDENGHIMRMGSNNFPTSIPRNMWRDINNMLKDIHAGKGLQS